MTNPDLIDALTTFIVALLGLATAAITVFGSRWLASQTNHQQVTTATDLAGRAVRAVEQMLGGSGPDLNTLKRQQAIDWLISTAKSKGITLTQEQAAMLVEAAVGDLRTIGTSLTPDTTAVLVAPPKTTTMPERERDPVTGRFIKHTP